MPRTSCPDRNNTIGLLVSCRLPHLNWILSPSNWKHSSLPFCLYGQLRATHLQITITGNSNIQTKTVLSARTPHTAATLDINWLMWTSTLPHAGKRACGTIHQLLRNAQVSGCCICCSSCCGVVFSRRFFAKKITVVQSHAKQKVPQKRTESNASCMIEQPGCPEPRAQAVITQSVSGCSICCSSCCGLYVLNTRETAARELFLVDDILPEK